MIDGYLLGALMLIFGFGLYELFVAQIQEAKASRMSARILRIVCLENYIAALELMTSPPVIESKRGILAS